MSRARASTPAAKRRAGARASASRTAKPRRSSAATAPRRAPAKRAAAKRATKRATPKRTAKRRRATAARRPPRRPTARRRRRGFSRPRPLRALGRGFTALSWRYRFSIVVILAASLAAGYFFWLRDSSLVAVNNVDVVGVTSGDREQIVGELTRIAEQQTTLHVDPSEIERAAGRFPTIAGVSVDPNFPHGMRIEITERPPALIVKSGGDELAVAADGTLLTGVQAADPDSLPSLELEQLPTGARLSGEPLQEALVLGAAPPPLAPLIEGVRVDEDYGVEVTLRGEIPIRFGSGASAEQKWAAAAAVLADPKLDALTYADVRVPERPTVGGAG